MDDGFFANRRVIWGSGLLGLVMLVALWFTLSLAKREYGESPSPESSDSRPAEPGCPVAFTSLRDFKGNKMCFGLGRYPEDPASAPGATFHPREEEEGIVGESLTLPVIASYQVRGGYVLEAFEHENFGGKRTIRAVGPATKILRDEAEIPFPGSMIVSLRRV